MRDVLRTLLLPTLRAGLWVGAAVGAGLLPRPFGALAALGVGVAFLAWYGLLGRWARPRACAEIRWRLPRAGWLFVLVLVGALTLFNAGFFGLIAPFITPDSEPDLLERTSVVAVTLVGPLIEEVAFRGWMLRWLQRRHGRAIAIVVSALAFAAIHLQLWQAPQRFVFGVTTATAVYLTRSLWPAILIHALVNGSIVALFDAGAADDLLGAGTLPQLLAVAAGLAGIAFCARQIAVTRQDRVWST